MDCVLRLRAHGFRNPPGLVTAQERKHSIEIQFAHFSVLEYLESDRMCPELSVYHIDEVESHNTIAEGCFAYLKYVGENEGFDGKYCTNRPIDELILTQYASAA